MNSFKKYFFLILVLPLFAFSVHKYYISLTKVDYSKSSKAIQITMRIFIDDLEDALNKSNNITVELATKNELKNANDYISKYLSDKFNIKIDNKSKEYNYLGKKYDDDSVNLYIEIENINTIESIEIQNRMLIEVFPKQQNIIKLNINNKKKSFFLTAKNDKDLLKF